MNEEEKPKRRRRRKKAVEPPEPTLEEKLLEVYANLEGYVTLQELVDFTGASAKEVSLTWHRLYDEGKVESPMFYRTGRPKSWNIRSQP